MEHPLYLSGEDLYELAKARPEWNNNTTGKIATREELMEEGLEYIIEPLEEGVEELIDRNTEVRSIRSEKKSSNSWASYQVHFNPETTEESNPPTISQAAFYGSVPLDYEVEREVLLDTDEAVLDLEGDYIVETIWNNVGQLPKPEEMREDKIGTGGHVRWKYNPNSA